MNKFWQTIIFFALISAMTVFIFSAIRPAQYLAESEFLVISDSIESDCNKNLGDTLARVIMSESFEEDLQKIRRDNKITVIHIDNLKVKNYKNSNIVNVKIGGTSLPNVQILSEDVQRTIISQAYKYYSPQDKIRINTLISSRIIRTPRVIMESTVMGLIGGAMLGTIIALLTGLRLDIIKRSRNIGDKAEKRTRKKEEKSVGNTARDGDYKTIIKKRLEKELSKEPIENLNLTDDGYVFKGTTEDFRKSLSEKKNTKEVVLEKDFLEKTPTEKSITKERASNVRVISASTMIVSRHDKEIKEDKVPENLPIFIEEKLPTKDKVVATKERIINQDNSGGENKAKHSRERKNEKIPGAKKSSAHDIANGFAPDTKNTEGPSNEEIKDRLNKLLRGEL
jgi:capsular polysaccharide biosynthesis protein